MKPEQELRSKLVDKFLGYSLQEIRELIIGCKEVQAFINGPEELSPIKTALDYTLNHYKKDLDPLKNLYTEQLIVADAVEKCISDKLVEVDTELGLTATQPKIDPLVSLTEQTLGKKCDKTYHTPAETKEHVESIKEFIDAGGLTGYTSLFNSMDEVAKECLERRTNASKTNDGLSKITKNDNVVNGEISIIDAMREQSRRENEMKLYADKIDAQVDKKVAFPMGATSGFLRKAEGTISKQLTDILDVYNAISKELDIKQQQETAVPISPENEGI